MTNKVKERGEVFTPKYIVKLMLDEIKYAQDESDLYKNIIDNSAGDGAFLIVVLKRYIQLAKKHNISNIEELVDKHIFGIEIYNENYQQLIQNLNQVAKEEGLDVNKISWKNIQHGNTLSLYQELKGKFDYVVGNPPYVRNHNIEDKNTLKSFKFSQNSNSDLYLTFFEIGLALLKKEKGKEREKESQLIYITPSSYFHSKSAKLFREHIVRTKGLAKIIDFEHKQIFNNATTYACITLLKNQEQEYCQYFTYQNNQPKLIHQLKDNEFFIDDRFFFGNESDMTFIKKVLSPKSSEKSTQSEGKLVEPIIKNGFATLCDNVFIQKSFNFSSKFIIKAIKASNGKEFDCLFPYKIVDGNISKVSEEELKKDDAYIYLENFKDKLLKRNADKQAKWFEFGRSQAILDVVKRKLTINNLTKQGELKIHDASNKGVFSGYYILIESDEQQQILLDKLNGYDFFRYVKMLKKYKNQGYYSFSTEDIRKFLCY